jgi:hypothetical protein
MLGAPLSCKWGEIKRGKESASQRGGEGIGPSPKCPRFAFGGGGWGQESHAKALRAAEDGIRRLHLGNPPGGLRKSTDVAVLATRVWYLG